jgi:hypothetical protein
VWKRVDSPIPEDYGLVHSIFKLHSPFDAEHYTQIATEGYTMEINHAFFPLPAYLINRLSSALFRIFNLFFGLELGEVTWILGVYYTNFISYGASVMLYFAGKSLVTKNIKATYSGYYYLFFGMMVYHATFQSEALFSFLFFSGLWVMFNGWVRVRSEDISPERILVCVLLFGLATMTRLNGAILFIVPISICLKNVWTFKKEAMKSFPYLMCILLSAGFLAGPILNNVFVTPY